MIPSSSAAENEAINNIHQQNDDEQSKEIEERKNMLEMIEENVNIGDIRLMLTLIGNLESNVSDLTDACQKLGDLSRELINRDTIREVGGVPVICGLLRRHTTTLETDKLPLYFQLCRVLGNLCFEHSVNALIICDEEGLSVPVVQIVCGFIQFALDHDDVNLIRSVCACIANFAHSDDGVRRKVVSYGGVTSLIKLIYTYRSNEVSGVLYHSLRALENVCEVQEACEQIMTSQVESKNALDIIIDEILANPLCEGNILGVAIKLVGLVGSHKEFNELTIEHSNLIQSLDNILMRYIQISESLDENEDEDEESVQEIVTQVIHLLDVSLVKVNNKWAEVLVKDSKDFINTLKRFVHSHTQLPEFRKRMQESVVEFLSNVAEIDHIQYYMATELDLIDPMLTLIESILSTLQIASSSKLLRFVVKLLGFLALERRNLPMMIEKGVVQSLTKILSVLYHNQLSPEYQEASPIATQMNNFIQRNCCIALGNMGTTDVTCKYIVESGATIPLVEMFEMLAEATDYSEIDISLMVNALFAFSNLTKARENQNEIINRHNNILTTLYKLATNDIHFIVCFYSLESLINLIFNNEENANKLLTLHPDFASKLVEVMKLRKEKVKVSFIIVKCLFTLFKMNKLTINVSLDEEFMKVIQEMETSNEDPKIPLLINELKQSNFFQ
ncbi:predicted protein [Naegleria gruberi]|uniref:Predicted protein n=1 Tax=Naegleria gruberi TaxID=5762 RepID=D2VM16_NAEGR|nr:uncharacterized protein NAEGRDRAFT_69978 [Naegleria gruberi]EFC42244.1 predicted protein [Naegleria gruberi]|eukprot:XP_002674988.1 predicted protein [Naegleria gruberi strain NEG-M]